MSLTNFNKDEVRELVEANRHNHITTTYYLILKKYIKMGRTSIADLASEEYIRYINSPMSLKNSNYSGRSADKSKNNLGIKPLINNFKLIK
jgi:5'-AMP-activated protein kinase catalytic alpha subunit